MCGCDQLLQRQDGVRPIGVVRWSRKVRPPRAPDRVQLEDLFVDALAVFGKTADDNRVLFG